MFDPSSPFFALAIVVIAMIAVFFWVSHSNKKIAAEVEAKRLEEARRVKADADRRVKELEARRIRDEARLAEERRSIKALAKFAPPAPASSVVKSVKPAPAPLKKSEPVRRDDDDYRSSTTSSDDFFISGTSVMPGVAIGLAAGAVMAGEDRVTSGFESRSDTVDCSPPAAPEPTYSCPAPSYSPSPAPYEAPTPYEAPAPSPSYDSSPSYSNDSSSSSTSSGGDSW